MRISVLASAHGSLLALEAVLAGLRLDTLDLVVNLDDLSTGPCNPACIADLQIAPAFPILAGNHERNSLEGADTKSSMVSARTGMSTPVAAPAFSPRKCQRGRHFLPIVRVTLCMTLARRRTMVPAMASWPLP